jgi:chromosome segregation ATPase
MADREAMREQNRRDKMAEMERRHEELKLERRAIDRVTEDFRTKIKEEGLANEDKCVAAQAKITDGKHKLKQLQETCKELEAHNRTLAAINTDQIKEIDEEYDVRRIAKQKLQFKEHQTIRKKMEKEKKCHPNDVFALNLAALEEDVKECAAERDAIKKSYDGIMNEASNKLSKIKYQKNSQKSVTEEKERLLASLQQANDELLQKHKEYVTGKSLLIDRLKFDTARLEKNIPRLNADLEKLDTYVLKFAMEEQNRATNGPK